MNAGDLRQGLRVVNQKNFRVATIQWVGKNTDLVSFRYEAKPDVRNRPSTQAMPTAKFLASFSVQS